MRPGCPDRLPQGRIPSHPVTTGKKPGALAEWVAATAAIHETARNFQEFVMRKKAWITGALAATLSLTTGLAAAANPQPSSTVASS